MNPKIWKESFKLGEVIEIKGFRFMVVNIGKRGLGLRRVKE